MRVLVALGGKALPRRGDRADAVAQRDAAAASEALARVAEEHEVVIAHSFDVRVGGAFALALRHALPDRDVATVLVDTVVGADDPGLLDGPPVLEPQAIVELHSLRTLIDAGVLVICAEGIGTTVAANDGTMRGIEAAIDTDLTAALLARRLDADLLVMLTDIYAVHLGWGRDYESALGTATPAELRKHSFASASMAPKVEAACRFVEATGRRAAIGELASAVEIVQGEAGTQISAMARG
jgi:carbamate kinase